MKTKNIFKTLAFVMLMPAMLLTTACSSDDDIVNNENTDMKGYALPVTINVTRQGDAATTRASYNEGAKTLSFSTGDQLFVTALSSDAGAFAGTLEWQSGGTFSGTIYTQYEYSGTLNALLSSADIYGGAGAILLPAGYEDYGYITIEGEGYRAFPNPDATKAFATSKAAAVEQLSYERATGYSNGFTLAPVNAILNFTITGLTANATNVAVSFTDANSKVINREVTADGSGTATFAIGVTGSSDLNNCSLTVGGNAITLVSSSTSLTAGKVYNITRSAPAP